MVYELRSLLLYTIFEVYKSAFVRAMLLTCRESSGGSTREIVHSQGGFLILFIFVAIVRKRNGPRECVVAGVVCLSNLVGLPR